ncbi:MAG TPA: DUF2971 domain-containing protein [Albitalea sp.]|uniref:DUF2971 domain-containing protein n=1 Tax=Piscinibacter sp. TaxID=1903157 RepID=UPI002ED04693
MPPAPKILYKYRAFTTRTIEQLCGDRLYFADPSTFNDPLDCKPRVQADCDLPTLERIMFELVRRRKAAEMTSAASRAKLRGPKTQQHIDKVSRAEAQRLIGELAYLATDPEYSATPPSPHVSLLVAEIELELLRRYDKGVFSLARRYDCPLMWSHYGEQHHGMCLGYAVPADGFAGLHEVSYGGGRLVSAKKVAAMVVHDDGDDAAQREVDAAVLLRKAGEWRYEREWRLLGPRGLSDAPLELCEVIFGLRCAEAVKHTVARALHGRERPVRLYEIVEVTDSFRLKRRPVDVDELAVYFPRRSRSAEEDFDAIDTTG